MGVHYRTVQTWVGWYREGGVEGVLCCSHKDLSYAKIAEISPGNQPVTIRNAIYGIQDKLNIETKQELVVWTVRNGLLDEWHRGR